MSKRQSVPVLMYHRVGTPQKDSIVPGQYVTPERLRSQLTVLRRWGFVGRSPIQVLNEAYGASSCSHKDVIVTFDDGYESVFNHAFPILQEFKFSSLTFLVSDCVGKTNEWDEKIGDVTEKLMSYEQVKEGIGLGMEFGCHTATHAHGNAISESDFQSEVFGSKAAIEKSLNLECPTFCYPYGEDGENVRKAVQAAGFRYAFSVRKGRLHPETERYRIPRINVRADTTAAVLGYKLLRSMWNGK